MSKRPSNFRQRDLRAAAIAARQAGIDIARIEIEGGVIKIIAGTPEPPATDDKPDNGWDRTTR